MVSIGRFATAACRTTTGLKANLALTTADARGVEVVGGGTKWARATETIGADEVGSAVLTGRLARIRLFTGSTGGVTRTPSADVRSCTTEALLGSLVGKGTVATSFTEAVVPNLLRSTRNTSGLGLVRTLVFRTHLASIAD